MGWALRGSILSLNFLNIMTTYYWLNGINLDIYYKDEIKRKECVKKKI